MDKNNYILFEASLADRERDYQMDPVIMLKHFVLNLMNQTSLKS